MAGASLSTFPRLSTPMAEARVRREKVPDQDETPPPGLFLLHEKRRTFLDKVGAPPIPRAR
jgi:hypothetical protein